MMPAETNGVIARSDVPAAYRSTWSEGQRYRARFVRPCFTRKSRSSRALRRARSRNRDARENRGWSGEGIHLLRETAAPRRGGPALWRKKWRRRDTDWGRPKSDCGRRDSFFDRRESFFDRRDSAFDRRVRFFDRGEVLLDRRESVFDRRDGARRPRSTLLRILDIRPAATGS